MRESIPASSQPRFVILWHETPPGADRGPHYDLMLEQGPALRTWALAAPPRLGVEIEAVALPDHRLAYLEFEGEISGGRGSVSQWDAGEYETLSESDVAWSVRLRGTKIAGHVTLERRQGDTQRWAFRWVGD